MISDQDYLESKSLDIDLYAFSERVGLKLGDDADNPTPEQLDKARNETLKGE